MWKKLKSKILNNRIKSLAVAGISGMILASGFRSIDPTCAMNDSVGIIANLLGKSCALFASNLSLILLGLPVFFVLWLFRTHDVQRQLDKAQGQIDKAQENINMAQENINNSTFLGAVSMLTNDDISSRRMALEQLSFLRENTRFDKKRIDLLTRLFNDKGAQLK